MNEAINGGDGGFDDVFDCLDSGVSESDMMMFGERNPVRERVELRRWL